MGKKINPNIFFHLVFSVFIIFIIVPVFYTIFSAVIKGNILVLFNKDTFILLFKSLLLAISVAAIATFMGTLMGFLLYKTRLPFRSVYKLILLIPLFISPYVFAVAWSDFFYLVFHSQVISSYMGVAWILILIYTPLAMIISGSAFVNINASLEESGLLITGFRSLVFKIILPLIKPALISSFILIFIFSLSNFSLPALLGVDVFTTEIYTQFTAFYKYDVAILQSTLLVIISIVLLLSEQKYLADAPFLSISNKGNYNKLYRISKRWQLIPLFWFIITLVLPFLVLVFQTFNTSNNYLYKSYRLLIHGLRNSFLLAFTGAIIIVFIGSVFGWYAHVDKSKSRYFNVLLILVFAIPSSIYGISLIWFYNRPVFNFIYATYAIIIIGYVGKFSFIAAKLIENGIKQIPDSLDEVAQISGISFYKRLQKIWFPLLLPTIFAAFMTVFIFNFNELGTTFMVYPPGTELASVKILTIAANAPEALISTMSFLVFLISLFLIITTYLLFRFIKTSDYGNY